LVLMPMRSRLTFANIASLIALVAALGLGTAWALERNSVQSRHIANDQVKAVDMAGVKALQNTEDVEVDDFEGDAEPTEVNLASARGFKFTGRCLEIQSTADNTATVLVEAKDPDRSWSFDSTADGGSNNLAFLSGGIQPVVIRVGPIGEEHFQSGTWALRSADGPGRGTNLQGLVSASIDTQTDCTFALSILG
jgi:hypothetical protein